MDQADKRLLNILQGEFPLVSRPFEALGQRLGLAEDEVIARVGRLKTEEPVIRQISAIFDTRSLGYRSSLVAMRVPPEDLNAAAAVVNAHPGVSHNYRRNHPFNMWFTIALPPASSLEATVAKLHELSGAESTRILPTLRLFKIGVQLDMEGTNPAPGEGPQVGVTYSDKSRPAGGREALTALEIRAIRELQEDVPLVPEPFAPMAARLGIPQADLLALAASFQSLGYMRRFAAVLHHREAGFNANAMGVWIVPEDRTEEAGAIMASFPQVSHCYLRPTYPDWPYNLFTMIHGRKARDCQGVIDAISEKAGIKDYAVLYSTKEYKKVRVKYFTEELDEWERHVALAPAPTPAPAGAGGMAAASG